MDFEDAARAVREGEQLDLDRLRPYLAEALGQRIDALELSQFPGGYSNLTYLLRLTLADGRARELVLRRPPFGSKVKRAHDMGREHRLLSALSPHLPWAPAPVAHCTDPGVLGAEFYLMERLRGIIVRRSLPPGLVIDADAASRMAGVLLEVMVQLHAVEPRDVGLADLGRPDGYAERQIGGWIQRYVAAATDTIDEMDEVGRWLRAHLPAPAGCCIIHNDLKFDNVIYADAQLGRIVGVLDWEMATIGDPLMDLGTTLSYWVEADDHLGLQNLSFGPTHLPGMPTRRQLADRYAALTGRDVGTALPCYVYGLHKTAVVLQQIYYRYRQGLTSDPRFAMLIEGVKLLARRAAQAVEQGEI